MRYNIIMIFVYIVLCATGMKAAEEKPDKKVFFHLNKSPKYGQLPQSQSQSQSLIAPGGARLDNESQLSGQMLQKQPPDDLSDDDEPGDTKERRVEEKKQISLEDIKLSQGTTAADLLRAYECASIQDAPKREMECNTVLKRLRDGQDNSFEIFQSALSLAQLKRVKRLQEEIERVSQSQHFPKGAQSGALREDQAKECRGCCLCLKPHS